MQQEPNINTWLDKAWTSLEESAAFDAVFPCFGPIAIKIRKPQEGQKKRKRWRERSGKKGGCGGGVVRKIWVRADQRFSGQQHRLSQSYAYCSFAVILSSSVNLWDFVPSHPWPFAQQDYNSFKWHKTSYQKLKQNITEANIHFRYMKNTLKWYHTHS